MNKVSSHNRWRAPTRVTILFSSGLLVIFLLVFPLAFSSTGLAHAVSPALSPGQWAHYSLSGNESQGTVDAFFTVQSVSGPNVTFTDLDTFADGHTTTDTLTVSILTGPSQPASGEYFVIAPQIHVGELVYPNDYHYKLFPIHDISARTYALASRQAAHVQGMNSSQVCAPAPCTPPPCPNSACTSEDFYWDQSTGLFTEIVKSLNGGVVLHVVMSSTNIWQAANSLDSYLVPSAVVSLMSAGLIGVIVVSRARRKGKRR